MQQHDAFTLGPRMFKNGKRSFNIAEGRHTRRKNDFILILSDFAQIGQIGDFS